MNPPRQQNSKFQLVPSQQPGHQGCYVLVPSDMVGVMKQRRPGAATAASVLGIISGSLGLMLSFMFITMMTEAMPSMTKNIPSIDSGLMSFFVTGTPISAVLLLTCGITFLYGTGHTPLIVGAVMQLLLSVGLIMLQLTLGGDIVVFGLFFSIIGVGLAVATLTLLFSRAVKGWGKPRRSSRHGDGRMRGVQL